MRMELRKIQKTSTGFSLNIPKSWEDDLQLVNSVPAKVTMIPGEKKFTVEILTELK